MSLFFVDSGSELSSEQIKMLGIECIQMPYTINDKRMEFADDFDYDKFYSKCRKDMCIGYVGLTTQEYIDVFEPCLQQKDDIIYVHTSSKVLSIDNLLSAKDCLKEKYPENDIYLIDSANFSMGYGVVAYLLALQYRKGDSANDIVDFSCKIRDEIQSYYIVDSLETMYNHNLITSSAVAGTILNVKPIVSIDLDGNLQAIDKQSGRRSAINQIIRNIRQIGKNIVDFPIGIGYSACEKDAIYLRDKLMEHFGNDIHIIMNKMSPSNSAIMGLGTLSVSFHVFKKIC